MKRTLNSITLEAMAASVPEGTRNIDDEIGLFGGNPAQVARIKTNLGLGSRRAALSGETSLDLCVHAARAIFESDPGLAEGIEVLVFVTQTPDHFQPSNSCIAHGILGLPPSVACLDLNLGCSGFVYGLFTAASMLCSGNPDSAGQIDTAESRENSRAPAADCESGGGLPGSCPMGSHPPRRALLLAGDTVSRALSPLDRSVAPIFGDGGSAAILRHDGTGSRWDFRLLSDGAGRDALIIPAGAYRNPSTPATRERTVRGDGITRSDEDLAMDGGAVMSFTLREIPPLLKGILEDRGWTDDEVDLYALHQANKFILGNISRAAGLSQSKVPWDIGGLYGNQSSASIPVTICHHLGPGGFEGPFRPVPEPGASGQGGVSPPTVPSTLLRSPTRVVMAGFGVGLSWGACACDLGGARILPVLEMPVPKPNVP